MPQNKLKRGRRRLSRAGADSGPGTPLGAGAIGRWTGKRILNSTNRLPPNAAEDPIPVFKCNIPVLRCIFDLIHRCANVCGPTRIEDNCGGDRGAGDAVGVDARPVLGAETRCVAFELGVFALGVRLLVQDDAEDVPLDAFHHVVEACLPLPQAVDLSLGERRLALAVGQELRHAIALVLRCQQGDLEVREVLFCYAILFQHLEEYVWIVVLPDGIIRCLDDPQFATWSVDREECDAIIAIVARRDQPHLCGPDLGSSFPYGGVGVIDDQEVVGHFCHTLSFSSCLTAVQMDYDARPW